jgi:hypothetical protein
MKRLLLFAFVLGGCAALCKLGGSAAVYSPEGGPAVYTAAEFEPPVRLKVGDAAIRVESPGYAAPCWADMNGMKHLFVGQFNKGKIQMFKHLGADKFAPGQWLQADGYVAEVPGVW